ncbi:hypothetical protein GCM10027275_42780 [Rhabdobacter roseus]|uniref:Uncharacterized protein n=1 Tax=Rhabdobacter roseus TaxID=1655419 RepID=A0A840U4A6_9BACT|nr:hypothetical protein [Rhabdobacter roseus]MBB5286669.1 hypothetical protein [Rhabdobacter roseus]
MILTYCRAYPKVVNALKEWYSEMIIAEKGSFQEEKTNYPNASLVGVD